VTPLRRHLRALGVVALLAASACDRSTSAPPDSAPTDGGQSTTAAPTSPSTPASAETTPPSTVDPVRSCVESLPLRERIALLVWPAVYSDDWATAQQIVGDLGLGGVILMKPDDAFAADLATHLGELDAVSAHGVLVATDEEGGAVQRLSALGVLPSQEDMSKLDDANITSTIEQHAGNLRDAGVDVVLGPVVDVAPADGSADPLGQERLFAGDPERVAHLAALYVAAWQSAGLLPTLKHFPGHGSASTDTHDGLATTPPLDELRTWDLVPYERLVGSGAAVMVGHLSVPGLTDGEPATRSAPAIALLRSELGWGDALVMTDALGMGAVGLPVTEASVRALQAGIDVVLFTSTEDAADVIAAIEAAVADGSLSDAEINDSAERVLRQLTARGGGC